MDTYKNELGISSPARRRVEKVVGCNTSIYVKPRNMPHYEGIKRMASNDDRSFSEVFNDSLRQVYFQQRTRTTVSGAAYLAIANGDLSRLMVVKRGDGTRELIVSDNNEGPDSMDCPDRTYPNMSCGYAYSYGAECLEKAIEPEIQQEAVPEGFEEDVLEEQQELFEEEAGL